MPIAHWYNLPERQWARLNRVGLLCTRTRLVWLSPHDVRHVWATSVTRGGTDLKSMQDAGGWKRPIMPLCSVERQAIATEELKLADE